MEKILFVLLLSVSNISYAGMDRHGNPTLDPESPPQSSSHTQTEESDKDSDGIRLINEVLALIKRNFYKEIDFNTCIPALLRNGVSECTDRYSYYLDPVQTNEELKTFTVGELEGIGATLEVHKDGGLKVLDVTEESPAEKAGLRENDVIIAVSSASVISDESWINVGSMPLDQAVNLIRGPKGTIVNLMVIRSGERKILTAIRDAFKIKFLRSKMAGEKIGYIKISAFGGEVSDQFYEAMQKLDRSGAEAVIIDLRNNGGGKLNSVMNMCALFANSKLSATILYERGRNGPVKDLTVTGLKTGKFKNKKIVILQNGNSASASEIFSGYMKHDAGATVVGEKSFGKGIVQRLIPLSNDGVLHLTVSEYFIGSKMIKVHGIGIAPTIEVKQESIPKNEKEDLQLQRAILEAEKLVK